jgi:ATP-dependent Clp protease ATP-binding subunit ClpX
MEGIELEFDRFAINSIVEKAMVKKTGARALRSIVEDFMLDIMYELPNKKDIDKCVITRDVIEKGDEPIFIKAEKKSA